MKILLPIILDFKNEKQLKQFYDFKKEFEGKIYLVSKIEDLKNEYY